MNDMNRQVVGFLFLLWLVWYLSGPLFETIDFWDTPQEEMGDIAWSASGALSLMAIGACAGICLFRRFRELCCYLASSVPFQQVFHFVSFESTSILPVVIPNLDISSLRI
jgi:hypothetical protein